MNQIDFQSFFQQLSSQESLIFFAFCLGAFLFGLLVGFALRSRKVRTLKKELKKKDEQISNLEAQVSSQEETIAMKDADLKKAAYDLNQVRLAADRFEQEKNDLSKQVFQLKTELDKKKQSNTNLDANTEELHQQIADLTAQNKDLTLKLNNQGTPDDSAQIKSLQQQISYLKSRNEELQAQVDASENGDGETTQARLAAMQQQVSYLKNQNAELMERLAQVSNTPDNTVHVDPDYSEDRLTAFEARLAQLENENRDLRTSLNQIQGGSSIPPKGNPYTPPASDDFEEPAIEPIVDSKVDIFQSDRALLMDQNKDDLSLIDGLGPFLEKKLNDIGVNSFEQIAAWTSEDIERITKQIQYFEGRIEKDNWVGQAAVLMNTPSEELPDKGEPQLHSGPAASDNLKVVEGIGNKIEKILKKAGIDTLEELAKADPSDISAILEQTDSKYRLHDPSTWPAQARLAANGDWDVLEDYQDKLQGGRDVDEDKE